MLYPVKECEEDTSIFQGLIVFTSLSAAWTAPFLLISHRVEPPTSLITLAICTYLIGIIIFLCSHIQKYFFLKYKSGLITDVFFSRCRNPNYLGEILIYLSFAILSQHWLPFVIIGGLIVGIFIPNMVEKDLFLSRYPEFAEYKEQSGLLIPRIFVDSKIKLVKTDE